MRYVVIGATAFPIHGYAHATLDIDIFIEATLENAKRILAALQAVGYDVTDITTDDLQKKKLLIRQSILETDIHPFVGGVSFEEVWRHRVEGVIGQTPASFAGLDDLIRMKQAASRPQGSRKNNLAFCCWLPGLRILQKGDIENCKPGSQQPCGARRRAGICCVAAPRRYHHIACVAAPCIRPPGAHAKMPTYSYANPKDLEDLRILLKLKESRDLHL